MYCLRLFDVFEFVSKCVNGFRCFGMRLDAFGCGRMCSDVFERIRMRLNAFAQLDMLGHFRRLSITFRGFQSLLEDCAVLEPPKIHIAKRREVAMRKKARTEVRQGIMVGAREVRSGKLEPQAS